MASAPKSPELGQHDAGHNRNQLPALRWRELEVSINQAEISIAFCPVGIHYLLITLTGPLRAARSMESTPYTPI